MMTMYVSPYRRMAGLRQAMDRLLDESMNEIPQEREMPLGVDVLAEEDAFTIRAMVPGLEADQLNIEIINNTVTIHGEFKGIEDEKAQFLTAELPQGRFSRVLALPVAVDSAKTEASLKNGILTLRVPKAESHRPRAIKVSAN
jgi:HSP20 family protein